MCQVLLYSIIFTSNKTPDKWGEFFGEDSSLLCALDRIFDDAMVFMKKGSSYRGQNCKTISITAGGIISFTQKQNKLKKGITGTLVISTWLKLVNLSRLKMVNPTRL